MYPSILYPGTSSEGESRDRDTLELPGHQADLLRDAALSNKQAKVILLLFNTDPVNITWAHYDDSVDAIIECFYPGQAAGAALYNTLLGVESPTGRLPYTWPASEDQVPNMTDYSMDGHTYRYFHSDPLYPFGYGLSYSTFVYRTFDLKPQIIQAGQNVSLEVTFENQGPVNSDEVVQVYMSWMSASVPVPKQTLVGFDRVSTKAGEVKKLQFTLSSQQMSVWHDGKGFIIEPGMCQELYCKHEKVFTYLK